MQVVAYVCVPSNYDYARENAVTRFISRLNIYLTRDEMFQRRIRLLFELVIQVSDE